MRSGGGAAAAHHATGQANTPQTTPRCRLGDPVAGSFTISQNGVLTITGSPDVVQGLFRSGGNVSLQSFVLAPVPEPESWAMLLAGLLLLIVYARKMPLRGTVTTPRRAPA